MKDTIAYTLEKGRPITWTIAATAGNVAKTLVPGAGYFVKVLYGKALLTTDASLGNRYVELAITDTGGNEIVGTIRGIAVAPSATNSIFYMVPSLYGVNTTLPSVYHEMGDWWYIYDTDVFKIFIQGGVAGDSWSARIKYLLVKR